jgi:DNA-binding CsgD family transcriptional regulator
MKLTAREQEVVQLVVQGKGNQAIAGALGITPNTVKMYLDKIYRKLGVPNRTGLAVWAAKRK